MALPRGEWLVKLRGWLYARAKSMRLTRSLAMIVVRVHQALVLGLRRLLNPGYSQPGEVEIVGTVAEWLTSWEVASTTDKATLSEVHGESATVNRPPQSIDGRWDESFQPLSTVVPPAFLLELPKGRIVGDGAIIGPDLRLIDQVTRGLDLLEIPVDGFEREAEGRPDFSSALRSPPRRLKGTTLVMSTNGGRGYFHWMFDVLPRLGLAIDAGVDLKDIDWFVVNNYSAGFQVETLGALGVDRRRVVSSYRFPHLVADRLIVPSLTREIGVLPQWVCDFLRRSFIPESNTAASAGSRRLYISRIKTDHGRVANERELVQALGAVGFEQVVLEDYNMADKVALFQEAELVVGPGGAGLANIVFCQPGAAVLELAVRGTLDRCLWDLANRVGVRPFYMVAPDGSNKGVFGAPVDVEAVLELVRLAGLNNKS